MKKKGKAVLFASIAFFILLGFGKVWADSKAKYSADSSSKGKSWTAVSDHEWTMDLNGDGKADVTLVSSINKDGQQEWKYTFNVVSDSDYYVYEQMLKKGTFSSESNLPTNPLANNYTSKGSDNKMAVGAEPGKITKDKDGNLVYTITNSKSHSTQTPSYGSLKITKHVDGDMADPKQKFTFDIKLDAGSSSSLQTAISGSKIFGDVVFKDGVGKVALGKGESKVITDLPAGLTYTITEEPVGSDYTVSSKTGDTGTITKDTESDSVWTNSSNYIKSPKGTDVPLNIHKTVEGSAAPSDGTYKVHLHMENLEPSASYDVIDSETDKTVVEITAGKDGIGDTEIDLKKDQTVTVTIPVGTVYQVNEEAGDYIASYNLTNAGTAGTLASESAANTEKNKSLSTARETAEENENVTVTFTNTYPSSQSLTIHKIVKEKTKDGYITYGSDEYKALSAEEKKKFKTSFTVTVSFSNLDADAKITSPVGKVTADEYGEASKTFTITPNEDVTFSNIPAGAEYQITEDADKDCVPSYEITTKDTYGKDITGTVVSSKNSASKGESLSTSVETVEANESDTVSFTNQIEGASKNFAIVKMSGTDAVPSAGYELFSYKDGKSVSLGEKTTDANGFAGWAGLSEGTYILKETKVPEGYTMGLDVLMVVQEDGTIKYGTSDDAETKASKLTDSDIADMAEWNTAGKKTVNGTEYDTYRLDEKKLAKLPNTGGVNMIGTITVISFVMALMVYIYIKADNKGETL